MNLRHYIEVDENVENRITIIWEEGEEHNEEAD